MNLWQTQLNFAIFCASSACGFLNITYKIPMIRSVYRFHVYYHIRRILKRLQVALPYQNRFSQFDNPYSKEAFQDICSEYGVDSDSDEISWAIFCQFVPMKEEKLSYSRTELFHG